MKLLFCNDCFLDFFSGSRNGLLSFPLNNEFINNYRRFYGPMPLTTIMNGNDLTKLPSRRSPVDSTQLKGNFHFRGILSVYFVEMFEMMILFFQNLIRDSRSRRRVKWNSFNLCNKDKNIANWIFIRRKGQ